MADLDELTAQRAEAESGPPGPLPGGYHWLRPEFVPQTVPDMQRELAEREPELRVLRRMLPLPPDRPSRFVDLGAGPGTMAAAVLQAFPRAEAVCVDFAEGRIAVGQQYLAPFAGRFQFVVGDLNDLRWDGALAGPFDAVVSAYAIHHLSDARKQALYQEIFARLVPGGAFLHLECIRPPNAPLRALYWAKGEDASAWARREHLAAPRPARIPREPPERTVPSLQAHLRWLRATGFVSVDCYFRSLARALFGGYRPLPPAAATGQASSDT